MPEVKIQGLMRSGTNHLQFMVERNFNIKAMVNDHAWKHGEINTTIDAYHLIIFKNIYAWISSLYDYSKTNNFFPESKEKNFSQFIQSNFLFLEETAEIRKDNPIQLYNDMQNSWLEANCEKDKLWIKYDNLILLPEKQMKTISSFIKTTIKNERIVFPCRLC
jgi:hypothetical protein